MLMMHRFHRAARVPHLLDYYVATFLPLWIGTYAFGLLAIKAETFRSEFLNHVEDLSKDIKDLKMDMPDEFDSGDSEATAVNRTAPGPMEYSKAFASSLQFKAAIAQTIGSGLTPQDLIRRAQTQTCAGCHRLSSGPEADLGGGQQWPAKLGFTHAELKDPEDGPDGKRFQISYALKTAFLPHRKETMENFLTGQ